MVWWGLGPVYLWHICFMPGHPYALSVSKLHLHNTPTHPSCAARQDSDALWRITPPARAALEAVLAEPRAALTIGWSVTRTAPLQARAAPGAPCVSVCAPAGGCPAEQTDHAGCGLH